METVFNQAVHSRLIETLSGLVGREDKVHSVGALSKIRCGYETIEEYLHTTNASLSVLPLCSCIAQCSSFTTCSRSSVLGLFVMKKLFYALLSSCALVLTANPRNFICICDLHRIFNGQSEIGCWMVFFRHNHGSGGSHTSRDARPSNTTYQPYLCELGLVNSVCGIQKRVGLSMVDEVGSSFGNLECALNSRGCRGRAMLHELHDVCAEWQIAYPKCLT